MSNVTMRFHRPELFALLPLFASIACGGGGAGSAPGGNGGASLPRFGSEEELVGFLEKHDTSRSTGGYADASGAGGASSSSSGSSGSGASGGSTSSPAPSNNETITNNQEAGVDEGGIVKNIDGALVILRKGRLYAVSIATAGAPAQTDSIAVAPSAALNSNVWYDEMLVRGSQIYVIGYRYGLKLANEQSSPYAYGRGATEVSSFRLSGGKLERQKTLFLESNDYFSGTNYASRMIDGKLVFYMPHQAWRYLPQTPSSSSSGGSGAGTAPKKSLQIPTYFTASPDGTFTKGAPIFAPTDVYMPLDAPKNPVFHTVVKCDLPEGGDITCSSRSLLSNWGREHYVTPKAVFLWSLPRAYMFRFDDLGVVAHKAAATPTDQFSFKEKDGKLHILGNEWTDPEGKKAAGASSSGSGDAPVESQPVHKRPSLVVESLPIADFDVAGEQSLAGKERVVEAGEEGSAPSSSYVTKNRFVGDAVFAGIVKYDYGSGATAPKAKIVRVELASGAVTTREIAGTVTRIEPMGDSRALVAIQERTALSLESLPVSGALAPQGNTRVDGLTEGESRSHGFFFKPSANTAGTFGLPIMNAQTGGGSYYGGGISNIGFWSVAESGALASLGVVSSSKETGVCETSCVDWYGNTRPIFIGDRAFALMGSELTEIGLAPVGRIGTPAVLTK